MSTQRQRGFTLLEIMVVIVILGILASLVVPNLMGNKEQADRQKAVSDIVTGTLKGDDTTFTHVQTALVPLAGEPARARVLLAMLAQAWRDILLGRTGDASVRFPGASEWQRLSQRYTTAKLLEVLDIVLAAPQRLQKNISFQTTVESTVLESQFKLAGL